jgi:hypothetical protein
MRVSRATALLMFAAVLFGSCGSGPVDPSKNTTETFSGTLDPRGIRTYTVSVNNTGEYSVKITALSPTPTAIVGTLWALGAGCELPQQRNDFSTLNTPALGGPIYQKGTYCVAIFDIGVLTATQNFTLSISHP